METIAPIKRSIFVRMLALFLVAVLSSSFLISCVGAPSSLIPTPTPTQAEGSLEVVYLDVGQANAAFISSEGQYMLIDGGNVADSSLVVSFLKKKGIDRLDYLVFSHSDEDHVGGLAGALNQASVEVCFGPTTERDTKAFGDFKKYLTEQNVLINVPRENMPESFTLGSATVTLWHIKKGTSDPNDNELVLRIENGSDSFLFTGDIDSNIERTFLEVAGGEAESDVLLVPHHGSGSSSGYVFLREVNPAFSVISVGENSYGHPAEDVLSRYRDLGTTLLRTDLHGDISFTSSPSGLSYTTQKSSFASKP